MKTQINTPQVIAATLPPRPDRPSVTVRMVLDARTGAYAPRSVLVEHPMVSVTPTLMARMRLGSVRRALVREALERENPQLDAASVRSYLRDRDGRPVPAKEREAPSPARLEQAAVVLRLARLVGDYPYASVARAFGIDRAQARSWARAAQARDLL